MDRFLLAPNFGKAEMMADPDGEFVRYSDVERAQQELERRGECKPEAPRTQAGSYIEGYAKASRQAADLLTQPRTTDTGTDEPCGSNAPSVPGQCQPSPDLPVQEGAAGFLSHLRAVVYRKGRADQPTCLDPVPDLDKLAAVGEEYGEVCRALQDEPDRLKDELFDLATAAVLWGIALEIKEAASTQPSSNPGEEKR